ncbi:MAG TPA: hypothetical protein VI997_03215, partial [Candidatus Thermoplasmatota archaeon]|nr:hypothetical protein [Candidatus Thermoplasmatota archaeon]
MDENALKGLTNSLGARIGERPAGERSLERLSRLETRRELAEYLGTLRLPHSAAVVRELEDWLVADWPARRQTLLRTADDRREERMDP